MIKFEGTSVIFYQVHIEATRDHQRFFLSKIPFLQKCVIISEPIIRRFLHHPCSSVGRVLDSWANQCVAAWIEPVRRSLFPPDLVCSRSQRPCSRPDNVSWGGWAVSSFGARNTFDAKFYHLPGISRSEGTVRDYCNKQCLAGALTLEIHPFQKFRPNYKKVRGCWKSIW